MPKETFLIHRTIILLFTQLIALLVCMCVGEVHRTPVFKLIGCAVEENGVHPRCYCCCRVLLKTL